ncbi:MAG: ABC transporter substrate-binding protein [Patescibacteria group bacterium]
MKKVNKLFPVSLSMVLAFLLFMLSIWYYFFGRKTEITVGLKWVNQAQFAGMFVAQEQGFYGGNGLDVNFKEFDFETNLSDDLISGRTDIQLMSAEEFLITVDSGAEITAVATVYQFSPFALVSLTDSGIKNPADFVGKTLGNKGGKKEEEIFYALLLNSVGLSLEDVNLVSLDFKTKELEDLQQKVDVNVLYRTDQLFFFDQQNISYNIIYPEEYGINIYNDVIVVRNELIKNNPGLIRDFLAATVKGWELAFKDNELAIKDTMKYVTNSSYLNEEYQRYILKKSQPLIQPDSNTSIGSMNYYSWLQLYTEMVEKGFIKHDLDLNLIQTNEFLP